MVTKIKPRRIKSDNPGSLGDFLGYQDEATFKRGEGGGLYTAGRGIEIVNGDDYSAMRGPCSEGFHIFKYSEQVSLQEMMVTLGINRNPIDYLKIPLTGFRNSWSSGAVTQSGESTVFWSVDSAGGSLHSIHSMYIESDRIGTNNVSNRGAGNVIRPIKDIPVIPNSTWITLFDGSSIATGAGVYHSPELGLISISDDGENRITIADKNLGATVVYENGDALSDANCGNLYQWGNNYGFTHDGTITTSYNKVNTTGYGPGNYYYGTTFILTHVSTEDYGDWSEEINDNLRGGVTGVITHNNAITNTGVLSVNGQTGDVIVDTPNVKVFYIETASDSNAQEAVNWYFAGGTPIISYENCNYFLYEAIPGSLKFRSTGLEYYNYNDQGVSKLGYKRVQINFNNSTHIVYGGAIDIGWDDPYLRTDINYTTPYTPTYNGSPATKKYVDDNINTKTFYLSSTSDLTTAQAAYDRWNAGKDAIVVCQGIYYYYWAATAGSAIHFMENGLVVGSPVSDTDIRKRTISINFSSDAVSSITTGEQSFAKVLATNVDYSPAYTPLYNGSPATKKYVDDGDTKITSTAPSNPTQGMLWYDTTNDVLKSYDGANWNNVNTQVTVEDNLTSTSTTNALSANQGRILDGKIADLMALGKFLSLWNAATGQPISFPYTTPYAYSTGDYFLVEVVDITTNYRPDGSSYTGTASSTVETDELEQGDVYIYDGSVWLLQSNHGKTVSFGNIAGDPYDNTNLGNALNAKQDTLIAGSNITIAADGKTISANNTTYSSLSPASGGVDVSLVTTGEKYTWNNKQNALSTQTAYTSKGTSTAVPTITTNTLGQVTGITETNIAFPVTSVNGQTGAVTVSGSNVITISSLTSTADATNVFTAINSYGAENVIVELSNISDTKDGDVELSRYYYFKTYGIDNDTGNSYYLFEGKNSSVATLGDNTVYQYRIYVYGGLTPSVGAAIGNTISGITNDTTGTTTTVTKIRAGSEAEYNSLGTYSQSTIYHIY